MNPIRSTIFMVSAAEFCAGNCDICGENAVLKYRDAATGHNIGACCITSAIIADRELSNPTNGIRCPLSIEEAKEIPNH